MRNNQPKPKIGNRLSKLTDKKQNNIQNHQRYSRLIRRLRLFLPLLAVVIIAVVFSWGNLHQDQVIIKKEEAPRTIGKNELINPHFESKDEKKQPFTITAKRALQGETNEDLIILEEPLADMLLDSGNWIAIKAKQGAFRQDNQRLLLKGDVNLFHDTGYQVNIPELYIDIEQNTAWSDQDVYGQGPAGQLFAKGVKADSNTAHLIFIGPAKMILTPQKSKEQNKEQKQ